MGELKNQIHQVFESWLTKVTVTVTGLTFWTDLLSFAGQILGVIFVGFAIEAQWYKRKNRKDKPDK